MITMKENMCGSVNTRCLQSIASICSVKLFVLFSTEIASICSIKLFLLFSTEISITEYRDVQYRVPRCRICSVPRCPDTV